MFDEEGFGIPLPNQLKIDVLKELMFSSLGLGSLSNTLVEKETLASLYRWQYDMLYHNFTENSSYTNCDNWVFIDPDSYWSFYNIAYCIIQHKVSYTLFFPDYDNHNLQIGKALNDYITYMLDIASPDIKEWWRSEDWRKHVRLFAISHHFFFNHFCICDARDPDNLFGWTSFGHDTAGEPIIIKLPYATALSYKNKVSEIMLEIIQYKNPVFGRKVSL